VCDALNETRVTAKTDIAIGRLTGLGRPFHLSLCYVKSAIVYDLTKWGSRNDCTTQSSHPVCLLHPAGRFARVGRVSGARQTRHGTTRQGVHRWHHVGHASQGMARIVRRWLALHATGRRHASRVWWVAYSCQSSSSHPSRSGCARFFS
jgi:hypothetical protein